MTDPLGASQVMPYLFGLSNLGHEISLLSFEKKDRYLQGKAAVDKLLLDNNISWFPELYTSKPPVLSTLKDLHVAKKRSVKILKEKNIQCVHCRSYISALVGLYLNRTASVPFIFDMRGFWANERIDGKIWSLTNPAYRLIYNYFKKKEIAFLLKSTHIISLTEAGKNEIMQWKIPGLLKEKITVIPCCTDTEVFKPVVDDSLKTTLREQLQIADDQTVLSYLGSFGTWYMAHEMFDFFNVFLKTYPEAVFLIITRDAPESILQLAAGQGISEKNIRIISASRDEVPALLSISHANLFFIKPAYSKKASSPTKMGESLSMGVPVICNDGIGDCTKILQHGNCGIIVNSFDEDGYKMAVSKFPSLISQPKNDIRSLALSDLNLRTGIQRYHAIYSSIEKSLK